MPLRLLLEMMATEALTFGDFLESFDDSSRKLALQDIVKACEDGEEKCTICMGSIDRPTMTSCHHVFCYLWWHLLLFPEKVLLSETKEPGESYQRTTSNI